MTRIALGDRLTPTVLAAMVLVTLVAGPASARVATGSSRAYGVLVDLRFLGGPTPVEQVVFNDVEGTAPAPYDRGGGGGQTGGGSGNDTVVAGETSSVRARSDVNGAPGARFADATATANGVDALLEGVIRIRNVTVETTAAVAGDLGSLTASGDSVITGGSLTVHGNGSIEILGRETIFEGEAAFGGAPNTDACKQLFIEIDCRLHGISVILNEQIVSGDGSSARKLEVNGIHIRLWDTLTLDSTIVSGDIIIAHAEAALGAVPDGADLAISQTDDRDPVPAGEPLTYTLTTTNNGPLGSSGFTAVDELSPDVSFLSASQGCAHDGRYPGGTVTCTGGGLPAGQGTAFTVTVIPERPGQLASTARVVGNELDPDPSNDMAAATTEVTAFAPGRRWMTGDGSVLTLSGVRAKHGFVLDCVKGGEARLEVSWGGSKFRLDQLNAVGCGDDPNILPDPAPAGFDTLQGRGAGRLNGVSGATVEWTFTDAGDHGAIDLARITITDPGGTVVLAVDGPLDRGHHQARRA